MTSALVMKSLFRAVAKKHPPAGLIHHSDRGSKILNGDFANAEWENFSFAELKEIKVNGWCEIDCELEDCWAVKRFSEIGIATAC